MSELRSQGYTATSGFRTQAHQDALRAQGLTDTRRSTHTDRDAIDVVPPPGVTAATAMGMLRRQYPGARVAASNGRAIHVTFPGWGRAPDVSGSARRYGGR